MSSTKEILKGLVDKGRIEAKFGKLENATYFKNLLAYKGIRAKIQEKLGNAITVDTPANTILKKHFLVGPERFTPKTNSDSTHKILGKFV